MLPAFWPRVISLPFMFVRDTLKTRAPRSPFFLSSFLPRQYISRVCNFEGEKTFREDESFSEGVNLEELRLFPLLFLGLLAGFLIVRLTKSFCNFWTLLGNFCPGRLRIPSRIWCWPPSANRVILSLRVYTLAYSE